MTCRYSCLFTLTNIAYLFSWGVGCAFLPGVFSRVAMSYDWIQETHCEESTSPSRELCGSASPTFSPSEHPTDAPSTSNRPTESPSQSPTLSIQPSSPPSSSPTSQSPTASPSQSQSPSGSPTLSSSPTISHSPTRIKDETVERLGNKVSRPNYGSSVIVNKDEDTSGSSYRSVYGYCKLGAVMFIISIIWT